MGLCSFQSALSALETVEPLETERIPVATAHGRILAEELRVLRPLPAVPVSAMDGYAVRSAETTRASRDRPLRLRRVGVAYAGSPSPERVEPGCAVRIFTGAALPAGADAVVRQEAAREEGGEPEATISIFVEVCRGKDVRVPGEELMQGTLLGQRGDRLVPARLALIATQGQKEVTVFRRPKVAVLATGDELVEPGGRAEPHQLYESNLVLVTSTVVSLGGEPCWSGRSGDDASALEHHLRSALKTEPDLLVTTGGASVGDRDTVKSVLTSLGASFVFDGVALKPGKPVAVARLGQKWILVLPGNPGAAQVAFDQLGRRLVLGLQGTRETRRIVRARLAEARRKQGGLTYFISARLDWQNPAEPVASLRPQGGQLRHALEADGYVRLPPGQGEFAAGEWVDVELFAGSRFEGCG